MNAFATIWRADSPLARCTNCGAQQQFHGRPNFSCAAFAAETVADIRPTDLNHRDLIRECAAVTDKYERQRGTSDDELLENDRLFDRMERCRAEIDSRIQAIFGTDFDDLRQTMGW